MSDDSLVEVLKETKLERFQIELRDKLQITQLQHFNHAKPEELTEIGMEEGSVKILLKAVKKRMKKNSVQEIVKMIENMKIIPGSPKVSPKTHRKGRLLPGSSSNVQLKKNDLEKDGSRSSIRCLIDKQDLKADRRLQGGEFGDVWKMDWTTPEGFCQEVAVKTLKDEGMKNSQVLSQFMKEVQAMQELCHPNLMKLHGVVLSPLMMVTELTPLGNLWDFIKKQCGYVTVIEIWNWAMQVISGLEYLQTQRYIQRELASRSVLLASKSEVKLGDFGLMVALPANQDYCVMHPSGEKFSVPWCAPESIMKGQYSFASDVWMFGVTFWEMLTGHEPWPCMKASQILYKIIKEGERLPKPKTCSQEVYDVMRKCWSLRPEDRPTVSFLRNFLQATYPRVGFALQDNMTQEIEKLRFEDGENIAVIEGNSKEEYWKGQNLKSCDIGLFRQSLISFEFGKGKTKRTSSKSGFLNTRPEQSGELRRSPTPTEEAMPHSWRVPDRSLEYVPLLPRRPREKSQKSKQIRNDVNHSGVTLKCVSCFNSLETASKSKQDESPEEILIDLSDTNSRIREDPIAPAPVRSNHRVGNYSSELLANVTISSKPEHSSYNNSFPTSSFQPLNRQVSQLSSSGQGGYFSGAEADLSDTDSAYWPDGESDSDFDEIPKDSVLTSPPPLPPLPPPAERLRGISLKGNDSLSQTSYNHPAPPSAPVYEAIRGVDPQPNFATAVVALTNVIPTASSEDVWRTLNYTNGNVLKAAKSLKVEQLANLGLGSALECENALASANWNLEAAATRLTSSPLKPKPQRGAK